MADTYEQHYHDKAEQDQPRGVYDSPHWFPVTEAAVREEVAYQKGWENAKKQSG